MDAQDSKEFASKVFALWKTNARGHVKLVDHGWWKGTDDKIT